MAIGRLNADGGRKVAPLVLDGGGRRGRRGRCPARPRGGPDRVGR
jgi:hypothetical protein